MSLNKPFYLSSYPWDLTNVLNIILTLVYQNFSIFAVVCSILIPQFLFAAIYGYFACFVEDIKGVINNFDHKSSTKLEASFVEMIKLHLKSLR